MIGIRTTTNVNDIDRRRGSPSTGGDQLQKPSLQELQHQSTLKARLRQSFQARHLFRTPSFLEQQPQESGSITAFKTDRPSNIATTVSQIGTSTVGQHLRTSEPDRHRRDNTDHKVNSRRESRAGRLTNRAHQDIQIRRLREPRNPHAHQTSKSEGCEMTHFLREN